MSTVIGAGDTANSASRSWLSLAIWLGVVLLLSLAEARIAVWLQNANYAPVGLFPIMLGFVFGLTAALAATYVGVHGRTAITAGVLICALFLVAAEHGFFYLDYRSEFIAKLQSDPKAQLAVAIEGSAFRPASFGEFMSAEAAAKLPLWIGDAAAMIAIAGLVAWLAAPRAPLSGRG
jgi:hypothetical protein